jgi:23S rRNA (uracil1939-C5)-methyltransferase
MKIKIGKLVYGGAGMARTDEGVIFVPRTLAGEVVEVELVDRKKDYAYARLVRVLEPSPDRREPVCPNFDKVGCCGWDHIAYEQQLAAKERIIRESLSRLGKMDWDKPIGAITGPEREYRLRATFHVKDRQLGFIGETSNEIVPIKSCAALMPALNEFIAEANEALGKSGLKGTEEVRAVASPETGKVAASFLRGRQRATWGHHDPTTKVKGIEYRLSPNSFFQANRFLLANLVSEVLKSSASEELVLDLFSGSAFFSLPLARAFPRVIGVDRRSTRIAEWNAQRNRIENVKFVKSSAWAYIAKAKIQPDLVILDPPRSGAGKGIVKAVAELAPQRVVYISCNPSTFSAEARLLLDKGYALSSLKFVDQFPNTYHIETVALFEKN